MDVPGIAHVARDGHSRVLLLALEDGLPLLYLEPAAAERGELHEVELEVGILELLRPAVVERMHPLAVAPALPGVGASLIPDESLDGERRPRRHHAVPERRGLLVGALGRCGDFRRRLEAAGRRPRLDARAAPRRVDDSHGDVKRVVELQRVVERHGGEVIAERLLERLGREVAPHGLPVIARLDLPDPAVLRVADERTARRGRHHRTLPVAVARTRSPDRAFHVRLPAREPHLADEHVLDLLGVGGTGHLQDAVLLGRGQGIEHNAPGALRVRRRGLGLSGERDRHGFARVGRPPHGDRAIALQNHIVGERRRRRHLRLRSARGQSRRNGEKRLHGSFNCFHGRHYITNSFAATRRNMTITDFTCLLLCTPS